MEGSVLVRLWKVVIREPPAVTVVLEFGVVVTIVPFGFVVTGTELLL